jgi:hypothetical protein
LTALSDHLLKLGWLVFITPKQASSMRNRGRLLRHLNVHLLFTPDRLGRVVRLDIRSLDHFDWCTRRRNRLYFFVFLNYYTLSFSFDGLE